MIDSNTGRWIVVIKLLHWFFAQYVIKILHKYVVLSSVKGQWVYIAKDDWCNMQKEFIKEKEETHCLVPWTPKSVKPKWDLPVGVYKFIPSSSGLRALFITKYKKTIFTYSLVILHLCYNRNISEISCITYVTHKFQV